MTISPMIQAIDLIRVNVDSMTLEDLEEHADQVLDAIGVLNEYNNRPGPMTARARQDGLRRADQLRSHMARVRSLINAHKAAVAAVAAAQAAGSANLAQGLRPFGL
ncbi:MAG: hypothetical protein D4R79_06325 [Comamonadaceae bacterium]|nr:MAG: hypothetical protein D4R79_06325 [Comamonadaceae bacterium]